MIIADANVWSRYLSGGRDKQTRRLDRALEDEEDVALIADCLPDILSALPSKAHKKATKMLLELPIFTPSVRSRVEAANLERKLKSKRVRIQNIASCLTSQACIELDAEVLSAVGDFGKISKHTRLKVCRV